MITNLGNITWHVREIIIDRDNDAVSINDDLRAFGAPSECWGLAFDGFEGETIRQVIECVHSYGVSYNVFKEELKQRCDGKWLHVNGLDMVFNF